MRKTMTGSSRLVLGGARRHDEQQQTHMGLLGEGGQPNLMAANNRRMHGAWRPSAGSGGRSGTVLTIKVLSVSQDEAAVGERVASYALGRCVAGRVHDCHRLSPHESRAPGGGR